MKIAFFGLKSAFDYFQIGGVESFIRRLSACMVKKGDQVDYIFYGADQEKSTSPYQGFTLRYFKQFDKALEAINEKYDHVITVYLLIKHRTQYAFFRKKHNNKTSFHFIYFGWPDSLIKRKLYFSEARFFPYNGKLFCISKRQYEYVKMWAKNAEYILPPVPEDYFLKPEEKPTNKKIKITFLGRIDPRKGILEAIELFSALKGSDKYECSIFGIHVKEDGESLRLHRLLKEQNKIKYIETDRKHHSLEIGKSVKQILKQTDILFLPYEKLSSTIDMPVTLLEAMASLCVVVTKPFGNIPDIYGKSEFTIPPTKFSENVLNMLNKLRYDDILRERKRIFLQNESLAFNLNVIGKKLLHIVSH